MTYNQSDFISDEEARRYRKTYNWPEFVEVNYQTVVFFDWRNDPEPDLSWWEPDDGEDRESIEFLEVYGLVADLYVRGVKIDGDSLWGITFDSRGLFTELSAQRKQYQNEMLSEITYGLTGKIARYAAGEMEKAFSLSTVAWQLIESDYIPYFNEVDDLIADGAMLVDERSGHWTIFQDSKRTTRYIPVA